jgi:hypothetical protein
MGLNAFLYVFAALFLVINRSGSGLVSVGVTKYSSSNVHGGIARRGGIARPLAQLAPAHVTRAPAMTRSHALRLMHLYLDRAGKAAHAIRITIALPHSVITICPIA